LAATFADYLLPALHEVPAPDVLLREDYTSPLNPLGIKGAGESGITAVGATIASAIDDAIGVPGAVRQLPITPQRLREVLPSKLQSRRTPIAFPSGARRAFWFGINPSNCAVVQSGPGIPAASTSDWR